MSLGYENEWLEFQFQHKVMINGIKTLVSDSERAFKSFNIQYHNGNNWTTIASGIRSSDTGYPVKKLFPIANSNKFRLNLINSYAKSSIAIQELWLSFAKGRKTTIFQAYQYFILKTIFPFREKSKANSGTK